MASFTSQWPDTHTDSLSPQCMAEAGFYYTGKDDFVKCYSCGGGLGCWQSGQIPMDDHKIWYPHCKYVCSMTPELPAIDPIWDEEECVSLDPGPSKTGYCVKQGGSIKTWKKRYFTLDERGLSYYKNETKEDAIDTISLPNIIDVALHKDGKMFDVVTASRTYHIKTTCSESSSAESWVEAIKLCKDRYEHNKTYSGCFGGLELELTDGTWTKHLV